MRFLQLVARAVVSKNLRALTGAVPLGAALLDIATDAWNSYRVGEAHGEVESLEAILSAELQSLAQAPAEEVRRMVALIVPEVADGQPLEVQQGLGRYLTQVPSMIRRSFRRPSDPSGTTVPGSLSFEGAEDLLLLLPPRLPRLEAGDQPLQGVRWELEELLGAGALGEVWKVRHADFKGITAVLKFCQDRQALGELRGELTDLDRLLQLGRHSGIVPLRQVYLDADPICLEYEFIRGGDLGGLILRLHQQQAASPDRIARLVLRLAQALRPAHRLKPPLIHRGLKPSNILVRRAENNDLELLITDFGASDAAAGRAIAHAATSRGEGLAAILRGAHNPLYASPQQLNGEPPDPRDDIHALGIIWHQLLSGNLRLGRPTAHAWRHPLTERGMTAELLDLLQSCFDLDADARPGDAGQLADSLETLLRQPAVEQRAAGTATQPAPKTGVIVKHGNAVHAVAFSPDGKLAASACFDGTVRVWETATGAVHHLWTIPGQNSSVAISPNGRLLVAGNSGGKLCAWDLALSTQRYIRPTGQGNVYGLAFSPDGQTLASANHTSTVSLWEPLGGKVRQHLAGHKGRVWAVAFAPDGQTLASGGEDATIRIWDASEGKETNRLQDHEHHVTAIAYSPDGRLLASGSDDGTVRLWELKTGLEVLRIATTPTGAVGFSPDGRMLVSADKRIASPDKQNDIYVWEIPSGKRLQVLKGHLGPVYAAVLSPDGHHVASGSEDGTARVWSIEEIAQRPPVSPGPLSARQLEELWNTLASEDAGAAYHAMNTLRSSPPHALHLLERRLQPVPVPDAVAQKELEQVLGRLIVEMEGTDAEIRHQAMATLQEIGPRALPILERLRDTSASRRTINQVALLLGTRKEKTFDPEEVREIRAVAILEHIRDAQSLQHLKDLAAGDPQSSLTREARAALDRLITTHS